MTDEKQVDPLAARIDKVNEAIRQLSALAYTAITDSGKPKTDADKADLVEYIQAIGILFGTIVVSLSEIADSVGKLARQNEADYNASVDAAATHKASVIHAETTKRSFIGQPRKAD